MEEDGVTLELYQRNDFEYTLHSNGTITDGYFGQVDRGIGQTKIMFRYVWLKFTSGWRGGIVVVSRYMFQHNFLPINVEDVLPGSGIL